MLDRDRSLGRGIQVVNSDFENIMKTRLARSPLKFRESREAACLDPGGVDFSFKEVLAKWTVGCCLTRGRELWEKRSRARYKGRKRKLVANLGESDVAATHYDQNGISLGGELMNKSGKSIKLNQQKAMALIGQFMSRRLKSPVTSLLV
ncbi:hypothetical protein HHI36_013024 [Cryptolaemus montrouzieri]|uniref:Uncharacterized protein n=1 Tax=Cryptolaemus montrouzieri TaxID=559131 RepID=A0ABD2NFY7_9CUCU